MISEFQELFNFKLVPNFPLYSLPWSEMPHFWTLHNHQKFPSVCHATGVLLFLFGVVFVAPPPPPLFPISLSLNPTAPSHTNIIIQPCKYVQVNAFFSHSH